MAETIEKAVDEKFCSECGAIIKAKAEICPKCGVRQSAPSRESVMNKEIKPLLNSLKDSVENTTKRPLGIILIIVYFAFGLKSSFDIVNLLSSFGHRSTEIYILHKVYVITMFLDIGSIYGLYVLRSWGRKIAIIDILFAIPLWIFTFFSAGGLIVEFYGMGITTILLFCLIDIIIIILIVKYLSKEEIQNLYKKKG